MNARAGFLVGMGVALLLVVALIGGWWLASDRGSAASVSSPAPATAKGIAPPRVSAIPLQTAPAAEIAPAAATATAKPKFEERELPAAEDLSKFLNGEMETSVKPEK